MVFYWPYLAEIIPLRDLISVSTDRGRYTPSVIILCCREDESRMKWMKGIVVNFALKLSVIPSPLSALPRDPCRSELIKRTLLFREARTNTTCVTSRRVVVWWSMTASQISPFILRVDGWRGDKGLALFALPLRQARQLLTGMDVPGGVISVALLTILRAMLMTMMMEVISGY